MTTFKAVEGHVKPNEIYRYGVMTDDTVMVQASPLVRTDTPCTIIPGHWASRIESGELLTLDEWTAIRDGVDLQPNPLHNAIVIAVCTQIARKLRGEA